MSKRMQLPPRLPLLLIGNSVLLPGSSQRFKVETPRNMQLVKEYLLRSASLRNTIIGFIPDTEDPSSSSEVPKNIHETGTAAIVVQISATNWPKPQYTLLAHGLCRFSVKKILKHSPFIYAQVNQIGKFPSEPDDIDEDDDAVVKLATRVRREAVHLIDALDVTLPMVKTLRSLLENLPDHALPDILAAILRSSTDDKLRILDALDLEERLRRTLPIIMSQLKILVNRNDGNKSRKEVDITIFDENHDFFNDSTKKRRDHNNQNRFQIIPIKRNDRNGDDYEEEDDLQLLQKKLDASGLPKEVLKVASREMKRLRKLPNSTPDHALTRNYLELLCELPWCISTDDKLDLEKAKLQLDEDHYSMEKLKKRVLEYLAVRQLQSVADGHNQAVKGPILCFVGPPGVGKTSVGRSVARTLGRKFHRISLGGVCDQSDIRGHRRTYVGSMPGRIISGLKTVGVNNPVFLLDEVDKLGKGLQGDPGAALLEVLDPEQNHTFVDHYLNVPYDLSSVLFIATANTTATIPAALLDRMEVIHVAGYTQEEKFTIARQHLLPKQLKAHGLPAESGGKINVGLSDLVLKHTIAHYTREAGVRDLDRKLAALSRAIALQVAKQIGTDKDQVVDINVADDKALKDILGPPQYDNEHAQLLTRAGVAAGLAWTRVGGEILYVEANRMPSSGASAGARNVAITLTGQLGDVMKESAQLAVSWLRSNAHVLGMDGADENRNILEDCDLHLHFPAGAVGKDGPSAGVTIVTALVSLFTGKLVRSDLAMTGEITLRGLVLPVGGIKEKVLAAHRAGMRRVVLPARNERDVEADLPAEVRQAMRIRYVESLEQVLTEAFDDDDDGGALEVSASVAREGHLKCKL